MERSARIKKLLLLLAGAVFGLLTLMSLTLAGLILWIGLSPASFWKVIDDNFLPDNLEITWEELRFEVSTKELLHPDVQLSFTGLRILMNETAPAPPSVDLNFDFSLDAGLNFFSSKPLIRMELVELKAEEPAHLRLSQENSTGPELSHFELYQRVYELLLSLKKRARLEELRVDVKEFNLHLSPIQWLRLSGIQAIRPRAPAQEDGPPLEKFDLKAKAQLFGPPAETAPGKSRGPSVVQLEADTELVVNLAALGVPDQPLMQADLKVTMPSLTADARLALGAYEERATLRADLKVQQPGPKLGLGGEAKLEVELSEKELSASAVIDLDRLPGPWVRVADLKLSLAVPQTKGHTWSPEPSHFEVSAPLALFFVDKKLRPLLEEVCGCQLPERLMTKVTGEAWLKNQFVANDGSTEHRKVADLRAEIESITNKFISTDVRASLQIEKKADDYRFHPSVDGKVAVASFQSLQKILNSQGIMVPAPLDVLEGDISLHMQGAVDYSATETVLPAELKVDLRSTNQSVKSQLQAKVKLRDDFKTIDLDVNARITELFLQLPPLDPLGGVPRVTKDSRILTRPKPKTKTKKSPIIFRISINVETLNRGAIRLYSKFAKPYVPLSLKVTTEPGEDVEGFIQVEPFSVTYLRRTVNLESLRLGLEQVKQGKESEFPLNGRLRVDQTDYRIFIDISGTTKQPQVLLTSEPSLTQDEIYSVLLFDRLPGQLDSGDAETAGGVQGAMADKAIGLFGLWAFATTPIRSFSYNPVTKTYTATLQVADGLTAGIGTNWEQTTNLELRKRVSRQWVLTAAWAPGENDDAEGKLVLQWEKRF